MDWEARPLQMNLRHLGSQNIMNSMNSFYSKGEKTSKGIRELEIIGKLATIICDRILLHNFD